MPRQQSRPISPSKVSLLSKIKYVGIALICMEAPIWQFSHSDTLEQRTIFIFKFRFSEGGAESPSGEEVSGQHHSASQIQDWWDGWEDGCHHRLAYILTTPRGGVRYARKQCRLARLLPTATHRCAVNSPPSRGALRWCYKEFWSLHRISRVCSFVGHDVDGAARC